LETPVLTQAGINRDSDGLRKECTRDPGFHRKRNVRRVQFVKNSTRLKKKTTTPSIRSHSDLYGTRQRQNRSIHDGQDVLQECKTFAIPPVAMFIVNHVHV
jgi:hypothetical protein